MASALVYSVQYTEISPLCNNAHIYSCYLWHNVDLPPLPSYGCRKREREGERWLQVPVELQGVPCAFSTVCRQDVLSGGQQNRLAEEPSHLPSIARAQLSRYLTLSSRRPLSARPLPSLHTRLDCRWSFSLKTKPSEKGCNIIGLSWRLQFNENEKKL